MSKSRQRSQWIIAGVLGSLGLLALYSISQILNNHQGAFAAGTGESGINTSIIADRTRAASPEMSWINSAAGQVEGLSAQVENLQNALRISEQRASTELAELESQTDTLLARYEDKITQLEAQLTSVAQGRGVSRVAPQAGVAGQQHNQLGEFLSPAAAVPRNNNGLIPFHTRSDQRQDPANQATLTGPGGLPPLQAQPFTRNFALAVGPEVPGEEEKHPPHLRNYLPAGSYAPALVLSGVDASTSVASQAEPVPVLFRITGPAITAGTRTTRGHSIDLTGCTVTGSARGDLSSERVYVRLLKLSCVQSGTHVFEREVTGYMSGAGKAGARGLVVSREGPLVRNAGIAGALSGLAEGVSSIGQAGSNADAASFDEALRGAGASSVAGGISGAADRLSEYYIERAEQYQPVVSLYGGTNVELVFMEGVDLG
ncbi:TrbI/VirB10 family protein [Yoonia sp. SS1-5]|uniref:TrbI/VirB10 family protein n=1 Tax=Yoonia rhodophyticola TaxID=3137370 RepID=A0AAN0M675_9RHOB